MTLIQSSALVELLLAMEFARGKKKLPENSHLFPTELF